MGNLLPSLGLVSIPLLLLSELLLCLAAAAAAAAVNSFSLAFFHNALAVAAGWWGIDWRR